MIYFTNMSAAGFIPQFFDAKDPRPAKAQFNEAYAHGGGFCKFDGFTLHDWDKVGKAYLSYPNDLPMKEISRAYMRDEVIILFQHEWLAIVQKGGTFEACRAD